MNYSSFLNDLEKALAKDPRGQAVLADGAARAKAWQAGTFAELLGVGSILAELCTGQRVDLPVGKVDASTVIRAITALSDHLALSQSGRDVLAGASLTSVSGKPVSGWDALPWMVSAFLANAPKPATVSQPPKPSAKPSLSPAPVAMKTKSPSTPPPAPSEPTELHQYLSERDPVKRGRYWQKHSEVIESQMLDIARAKAAARRNRK